LGFHLNFRHRNSDWNAVAVLPIGVIDGLKISLKGLCPELAAGEPSTAEDRHARKFVGLYSGIDGLEDLFGDSTLRATQWLRPDASVDQLAARAQLTKLLRLTAGRAKPGETNGRNVEELIAETKTALQRVCRNRYSPDLLSRHLTQH
jgi:hypothetical protein